MRPGSHPPPSPPSLAGSLLVAQPSLRDPNFSKTVILIVAHEEEGSMGFILNRPSDKRVADLVADREELPEKFGEAPVFFGGPVASDQLVLAGLRFGEAGDGKGFLKMEHQLPIANAEYGGDDFTMRAFLGYAGWTGGQLENELVQMSWFVVPPGREIIELGTGEDAWKKVLRGMGPLYRILAETPDDPSLN